MTIIYVALGGALGAVARYLISTIPIKGAFPVLTLITNLLGAIIIGIIVGITDNKEMPSFFTPLFKTGFCGGFTTFSTFSLETWNLIDNKKYGVSGLYAISSLFLCVLGVYLGKRIVKR